MYNVQNLKCDVCCSACAPAFWHLAGCAKRRVNSFFFAKPAGCATAALCGQSPKFNACGEPEFVCFNQKILVSKKCSGAKFFGIACALIFLFDVLTGKKNYLKVWIFSVLSAYTLTLFANTFRILAFCAIWNFAEQIIGAENYALFHMLLGATIFCGSLSTFLIIKNISLFKESHTYAS